MSGGHPRALTGKRLEEAMRLLRQPGASVSGVAAKMGVSWGAVERASAWTHTPLPPKPRKGGRPPALTPRQDAAVARRLDAGEDVTAVARRMKTSPASVRRAYKRATGKPVPGLYERRGQVEPEPVAPPAAVFIPPVRHPGFY